MREHVDWSVFGVVPLEIYMQIGDQKYFEFGIQKADKQWENPLPKGLSPQTRYWIDDMYMISSLQTQAYRATKNIEYINRTANQMVAYLDTLQQPNGLFLHGFRGPFFWGRGNGWMAAGMTELLRELPEDNPNYTTIMNSYRKMMTALLEHQNENGVWRQLVDYPEAWEETSSTGMFTYALITGVKNGWLEAETFGPAARKAWLGLVSFIDDNANVREVCKGMGQRTEPQRYLDAVRVDGDFHGQAPVLWCVSALLR
jgi:rhamnogalacturonyl hydrolase YesR